MKVLFTCSLNTNLSLAAEAIARKLRTDLEVKSCAAECVLVGENETRAKMDRHLERTLALGGYSADRASGIFPKASSHPTVGGYTNGYDLVVYLRDEDKRGNPSEPSLEVFAAWMGISPVKMVEWYVPSVDTIGNAALVGRLVDILEQKVREL